MAETPPISASDDALPHVTGSVLRPVRIRAWVTWPIGAALVAVGLAMIVAIQAEPQPKPWEYFTFGAVYGTLFGQATLAGAWAALGPGRVLVRQLLSLVWLASLVVAIGRNHSLNGMADTEIVMTFAAALFCQWLLVQAILWGIGLGFGVRLVQEGPASRLGTESRQFGIRDLFMITAVVAAVLGVGRIVVPLAIDWFDGFALFIISYVALAGVAMMIPLLVAALLPRRAWLATLVALVLVGLGTAVETPLLETLRSAGAGGGGPLPGHFYGLNGSQAAWVLAFAGAVRLGGYRLRSAR
jgi:hypothetical protein